jgi:hypothetical protein
LASLARRLWEGTIQAINGTTTTTTTAAAAAATATATATAAIIVDIIVLAAFLPIYLQLDFCSSDGCLPRFRNFLRYCQRRGQRVAAL